MYLERYAPPICNKTAWSEAMYLGPGGSELGPTFSMSRDFCTLQLSHVIELFRKPSNLITVAHIKLYFNF